MTTPNGTRPEPGKLPPEEMPSQVAADSKLAARWTALRLLKEENWDMEQAMKPYGAFVPFPVALAVRLQTVREYLAKLHKLKDAPYPQHPDPVVNLGGMVQSLIEVLFPWVTPEGREGRLSVDEAFHRGLHEFLMKAKSEVVQAQLAAGTNLSPAMLRLMDKEAKKLRGEKS